MMRDEDRNQESEGQILKPEPFLTTHREKNHITVIVLVLTFLLLAVMPLWAEDVDGQVEVGVAWQGKSMMPEQGARRLAEVFGRACASDQVGDQERAV